MVFLQSYWPTSECRMVSFSLLNSSHRLMRRTVGSRYDFHLSAVTRTAKSPLSCQQPPMRPSVSAGGPASLVQKSRTRLGKAWEMLLAKTASSWPISIDVMANQCVHFCHSASLIFKQLEGSVNHIELCSADFIDQLVPGLRSSHISISYILSLLMIELLHEFYSLKGKPMNQIKQMSF